MDFEREFEQVAQQYRDEGYAVLTYPNPDQLDGLAADILATRGRETVLVQVKRTRDELEADASALGLAAAVTARPGWRYDLVVLGEGDPIKRLTRGSREPSRGEIEQSLSESENLLAAGHAKAACVVAWATLEAVMRRVADAAELSLPSLSPAGLLQRLHGNGLLSEAEYADLNSGYRTRTALTHGLVPPTIDPPVVRAMIATTRRFLAERGVTAGVAG